MKYCGCDKVPHDPAVRHSDAERVVDGLVRCVSNRLLKDHPHTWNATRSLSVERSGQ